MATRSKSASYLSAKSNFFTERNNTNNFGKRRREDGETPPEVTLTPPERTDSERTITENVLQQNNQQQDFFDEREVVKMDRLVDKKDRYESHIQFLTKCLSDKVVPLYPQAGTNMSTKDIMSLIQSTMKTLNDFATRLDNQDSPQIRPEM